MLKRFPSSPIAYPQFALGIAVKSPQRGWAGAAKAKRGLVTENLTAASTGGGDALLIQKAKGKIQKLGVLPKAFSRKRHLQTPYIDPLLRFCCGL